MRLITVIALLTVAAAGLTACSKKVENPPDKAVVSPAQVPTVNESFSAMLRGHPNSIKICYDESYNGFYLYYGELLKAGEPDDNKHHGWLFIQDVKFYITSAGSWFIAKQANDKYVQIYPDVIGLQCKDQ